MGWLDYFRLSRFVGGMGGEGGWVAGWGRQTCRRLGADPHLLNLPCSARGLPPMFLCSRPSLIYSSLPIQKSSPSLCAQPSHPSSPLLSIGVRPHHAPLLSIHVCLHLSPLLTTPLHRCAPSPLLTTEACLTPPHSTPPCFSPLLFVAGLAILLEQGVDVAIAFIKEHSSLTTRHSFFTH